MEHKICSNTEYKNNVISIRQKSYRIILIGHNDEVIYIRKFCALDDKRAITIAENMYNGLEVDLWQDERYVKNFPAQKSA